MAFLPKPKLMGVAQLNDKGQLVIPKAARDEINLEPGDRVIIAIAPFGEAILIAKPEQLEAQLQEVINDTRTSFAEIRAELHKLEKNGG